MFSMPRLRVRRLAAKNPPPAVVDVQESAGASRNGNPLKLFGVVIGVAAVIFGIFIAVEGPGAQALPLALGMGLGGIAQGAILHALGTLLGRTEDLETVIRVLVRQR